MSEPGRPQPVLAEQVTLTAAAQHVGRRDPQVGDADLAVVVAARHGLDVPHDLPSFTGEIDDEGGVAGLADLRIILGAGDQDGEASAARPRDKPLVAVDDPLVAVLNGLGADEGGIRSRHLGLGQGEARPEGPRLAVYELDSVAQRLEIALLLVRSGPAQQGVHVSLVRSLGVQYRRPHPGAGGLG